MAHRWNVLPRRWKAIGAVAALLLVSAVVPLQLAAGSTPATPIAFDAGNLKLHMSTDASRFQYFDATGTQVGGTQSFSASPKCGYVTGANGNLLMQPSAATTPSVSGTVVGYLQKDNGYGLGVNKGGKEGTGSCTQTNIPEQLTLELQNDPATSPVRGLFIDHTNLDMEFKYNAVLTATYYRDGALLGSNPHGCTNSDCGPDSGGGDNYRVNLNIPDGNGVEQPFDKVVLTVTSTNPQGAVTLEGGNDVGTTDSVFHLVKFLTPADCANPIEGEGGGTNVTIHLLENSGVCPDKGYSLDVTSRSITFETSGNGGTPGQWIVDVNDWSPEPAINPVPATTVFPPANGELAVWCDGNYTPNSGGTLGASMPNGGHSWCLIHQEASIVGVIGGVQQMQVNELYLLQGDAVLCRKCT